MSEKNMITVDLDDKGTLKAPLRLFGNRSNKLLFEW